MIVAPAIFAGEQNPAYRLALSFFCQPTSIGYNTAERIAAIRGLGVAAAESAKTELQRYPCP